MVTKCCQLPAPSHFSIMYFKQQVAGQGFRGVASNEAEEAVASSLLCARARARIGTSMREVNYITMTDLTRTINRGWAALITTFFT